MGIRNVVAGWAEKFKHTPHKRIIVLPILMALTFMTYAYLFPSDNKNNESASKIPSSSSATPISPAPSDTASPAEETAPQQEPEQTEETTPSPPPAPSPTPTPAPTPVPAPEPPPPQPTPSEISRGNTGKQQVIFTFDAGAGTQSLSAILTTLAKYGVRATFFVTGKWAEANPSGVSQINAGGHQIFNHTYDHPDLTTVSDGTIIAELQGAENVIKPISGTTTKPFFRPPYGARTAHVRDVAWSQGYRSVYWTVDALDWQDGATADQVKARILNNVSPGAIYLMHIGDTITGQVLDEVFSTILSRGYKIVSLTDGIG